MYSKKLTIIYRRAILKNDDVIDTDGDVWFRLWKNDYWGNPLDYAGSHQSYRPITIITFRLLLS